MKRAFDIVASGIGLVLLAPLFAVAALAVKLTSAGPVFFCQQRVGKLFRPFTIYKFRTMVADAPEKGGQITSAGDHRITRVGAVLRRVKMDELPQLVNVFKGDMSLVGPRPEVQRYVDQFQQDYQEILTVRPGITDLASLKYRDESEVLGQYQDPAAAYVAVILPDKIALAKEYVRRSSLLFDIGVIFRTLLKLAVVEKRTQGQVTKDIPQAARKLS